MAPEGLANVVRFPWECPKCSAMAAMPSGAGTFAERRTQVDLKCTRCRHEWFIEMTPPVLMVTPDRETDHEAAAPQPAAGEEIRTADRRNAHGPFRQRLRVGQCGLLKSTDRANTITVLYTLDAQHRAGRLRLTAPGSALPGWLAAGSRLWLSGYDGVPLRIRVTQVAPRREEPAEGDHFAEFVVPPPSSDER